MAVTLETPDDVVMITNNTIDPWLMMPFTKVGPAISQVQEETYRFNGFFTTKVTAGVREKHTSRLIHVQIEGTRPQDQRTALIDKL